jgi:hypothetical protein
VTGTLCASVQAWTSAGAWGGVDSPWKDEARSGHIECDRFAPGVMAKLAAGDLRGYLTRPIFAAPLIQRMKFEKQKIGGGERGREEPSVRWSRVEN